MVYVYVVGSFEKDYNSKFIADIVLDNLKDAITYCKNRKEHCITKGSDKYWWMVMKVPFGKSFIEWDVVYD